MLVFSSREKVVDMFASPLSHQHIFISVV